LPVVHRLSFALLAAVVVAPAPAQAADPDLWATINLCDTPSFPDAMGVRASMPGNGTRQRMYMRFNATFYSRTRQAWYRVKGNGRSRWIYAGTAKYRSRQAGWTFQFKPPRPGSTFVVRGVVEFQWRAKKKKRKNQRRRTSGGYAAREVVVDKARANTRRGIPNVGVGDPPGTSEGLCEIR
jgi:hypothetical protein